jgi:hypothetical protein
MSSTKNIGQVVGLYIGTEPPSNTVLIWYDETPNQCCHKVYNKSVNQWQALDPEIVAITTYSELVNNAKKNGLSIGKYYEITDKSNVLAVAITTTKVQYSDGAGNILVDDLGTNIQYHVSSSNILIDDVNGVFSTDTNKLVFSFDETDIEFGDDDYVLGKFRRGTKWLLGKFKLSKLLSTTSGNSITWKDGFFFSFSQAIKNIIDKAGGVVGKDTYDSKVKELEKSISNVSKENQTIISDANTAISNGTSNTNIYNKKLPTTIDTTVVPADVQRNDTLSTIVSKFQRWINKFKYATGVSMSKSYSDATSGQYVNNNDTVETAIGKLQYWIKNPESKFVLTENYNKILVLVGNLPVVGDSFLMAIKKLSAYLQHAINLIKLPDSWTPKAYTTNIALPAPGDTLSEAFSKAIGKFNQIGLIYDGVIEGRERNDSTDSSDNTDGTPKLRISFKSGNILLQNTAEDNVLLDQTGLTIKNNDQVYFEANRSRLRYYVPYPGGSYPTSNFKPIYASGATIYAGAAFLSDANVALSAKCKNSATAGYYDAFFGKLGVGGLVFNAISTESDFYVTADNTMVLGNTSKGNSVNVYLPSSPENGRIVYVSRMGNGGVNVYAQGTNGIDKIGSSVSNVSIDSRGKVYMFVFIAGIYYDGESVSGLWQFAILTH